MLALAESLANLGYWRSDRDRDHFVWSPQMYRIMGVPPGTPLTREVMRALYHPDDGERLEAMIVEARETGVMPPLRGRVLRPDGKTVHVLAAGQMDGATSLIGILRDITEEVEAERALIQTRDHARMAERTKAELLAVMSHEIRSPINGLLGSIEGLRGSDDEAERSRLLENLAQSASTVMTVVDDMIDYSRVEAGRLVIESVRFDLKAAIRTTTDLFRGGAAARGLKLEVNGLDGDPVIVRGDSARVQQLLSNLIGNAIKYSDAGTVSISISPTRSDRDLDYWMVIVRDSGRGIDQDLLGRIFARGDDVDPAKLRLQGGTGLGLALSQQLAEAMGGSIAVSSESGRGTTFSIELPFKQANSQAGASAGPAPLSILLAEDNPINRRLMAGLLSREGHQVVAVEDGRKALSAMAIQSFDLILMDMQMPELDGIGATQAIRALDPPACDTPILAISADAQPDRRRIYFEAGIDSFLAKPIVSGQLIEMIGKMRRVHRASAEPAGDHLDRERLSLMAEKAGDEDMAVLTRMLLADINERPRRIGAAVRSQAWELAAAEADALRVLLDGFGSFTVSRLLGAIARQCVRHTCPPPLLDELLIQAGKLAILLDEELGAAPVPLRRSGRI